MWSSVLITRTSLRLKFKETKINPITVIANGIKRQMRSIPKSNRQGVGIKVERTAFHVPVPKYILIQATKGTVDWDSQKKLHWQCTYWILENRKYVSRNAHFLIKSKSLKPLQFVTAGLVIFVKFQTYSHYTLFNFCRNIYFIDKMAKMEDEKWKPCFCIIFIIILPNYFSTNFCY